MVNESILHVHEFKFTLTLTKVFQVQLFKNNVRALLLRILSILNSDWLQLARSVSGVYEWLRNYCVLYCKLYRPQVLEANLTLPIFNLQIAAKITQIFQVSFTVKVTKTEYMSSIFQILP